MRDMFTRGGTDNPEASINSEWTPSIEEFDTLELKEYDNSSEVMQRFKKYIGFKYHSSIITRECLDIIDTMFDIKHINNIKTI